VRLKRASIPILSRSAQKIPSIAFSFLFSFLLGTNRTNVVFERKDCRLARDRMLGEYSTICELRADYHSSWCCFSSLLDREDKKKNWNSTPATRESACALLVLCFCIKISPWRVMVLVGVLIIIIITSGCSRLLCVCTPCQSSYLCLILSLSLSLCGR
jgi:hypothetical protein